MIPIMILEVNLKSLPSADFGKNPGSTIRGAFYDAFRWLYDTGYEAQSSLDETNPVSWMMRLTDPNDKGGESLPRPFAIRPPLAKQPNTFSILLYGNSCKYVSLVLSAIDAMQTIGLGVGKRQFKIDRIYQIHPITHIKKLLIDDGKAINKFDDTPSSQVFFAAAKNYNTEKISVEFLTPTRIVQDNVLSYKPVFLHWFSRLLGRIRRLSELYTPDPIHIDFSELTHLAAEVEIQIDYSRWEDSWSHSSRRKQLHPTSGFVGHVVYIGNLQPLLPFIISGQALHVGKNTAKGCGWYRLFNFNYVAFDDTIVDMYVVDLENQN